MAKPKIACRGAWAVVTGAGSGIGCCYARRLSSMGFHVALVGDMREPLEMLSAELEARYAGQQMPVFCFDLARQEAAEELYAALEEAHIAVDVLINNAGIFSYRDVLATPVERIERMILLHTMTNTKFARLCAAQMVRRGVRGYILNMASYSLWMPFPGMALYTATKAYLRQFSVCFAKEMCEHGIRVTAVCPAGVATDLYGLVPRLQRFGVRVGALITPERCARRGLNALWRGERTCVPDWWNRLFIPFCKLMPLWLIRPLRRYTMQFQK